MTYELFEHDRVKKFFKKHKKDKALLLRITKKYFEILNNPYHSEFIELIVLNALNAIGPGLEIIE